MSFLKIQIQNPDYTHKKIAKQVAKYYSSSLYISKKNCHLEDIIDTKRYIKEKKQDYHTKSHFWFNDEKIQLVIHKCISFFDDKLLAQKVAKAVKNY